jgi:hypothetical protein
MASKRNGNSSKKSANGSQAKSAAPAVPAPLRTAAAAPPAPPQQARPLPSVPARSGAPSPGNLAFEWSARQDGGGELTVVYEGPLAGREAVLARAGSLRSGGAPWAEARDFALTRAAPGRFVGAIAVSAGAPVEARELAFHAGEEWDNGGRAPLGYYEWSVRERQVVVR